METVMLLPPMKAKAAPKGKAQKCQKYLEADPIPSVPSTCYEYHVLQQLAAISVTLNAALWRR